MTDLALEGIYDSWAASDDHAGAENQIELLLDQMANLPEIDEPELPPYRPGLELVPMAVLVPALVPATWSRADDDILPRYRRFRRG